MTNERAEIGIFGGSGFYSFLDDAREVEIETPYGAPSAPLTLGSIGGRSVAFLPRHGKAHQFPPHMINYRANLWAMQACGVSRIVGPCAVGSLRADIHPGEFLIADQLVDRTTARKDTFYDGPKTTHVSFADPYCPTLRPIAVQTARDEGITVHDRGTMVVIQGPRFSTRAESRWFSSAGWSVVGMTQYPEAYLARELEICFVNVSLVTDYDAGLEDDDAPVTHEGVLEVFDANVEKVRRLLFTLVPRIPAERDCPCATALGSASSD
jgi:5'-methylthioadenosine phosphorylase